MVRVLEPSDENAAQLSVQLTRRLAGTPLKRLVLSKILRVRYIGRYGLLRPSERTLGSI